MFQLNINLKEKTVENIKILKTISVTFLNEIMKHGLIFAEKQEDESLILKIYGDLTPSQLLGLSEYLSFSLDAKIECICNWTFIFDKGQLSSSTMIIAPAEITNKITLVHQILEHKYDSYKPYGNIDTDSFERFFFKIMIQNNQYVEMYKNNELIVERNELLFEVQEFINSYDNLLQNFEVDKVKELTTFTQSLYDKLKNHNRKMMLMNN